MVLIRCGKCRKKYLFEELIKCVKCDKLHCIPDRYYEIHNCEILLILNVQKT
jgi:hypothetical protein